MERVLGEGGMAAVYLAQDRKHNRQVAIKVMRPELASTLGADRFLREVEIAAQLNHPHILPMYDSGQAEGILYYVMPYVEGESLLGRIRREKQLPIEDVLRLGGEIAEALSVAHGRGIVHRDIKPANVLLSGGHALVADFGIARAVGTGSEAITATGIAIGTPHYMSPEQATGDREVDARTDIYALGAVLYEALAGEPPFTGPTAQAILSRSLMESPRPITSARPAIPVAVNAVIMRALSRSPADRFQTAADMAAAMRSALDSSRSGAIQVTAVPPPAPVEPATSIARVFSLFGLASAAVLFVTWTLVRQVGLPGWMFWLGAVLLLVGLPVLLATARAEASPVHAKAGLARLLTWRNAIAGGVLAFAGWGVLASTMVLRTPGKGATPTGPIRLAVMPFVNQGDSADAYFVDGIADQLRGKLTDLGAVEVIARSSSDLYRGTKKSMPEIGREMDVGYLLAATVRTIRNPDGSGRVQVVPELIRAKTGAVAWQQTFDAPLTDVFQVQSDIAVRVADALDLALGTKEQQQLTARPTKSLPAYDAFLKAEAARASSGGPIGSLRAIALYEQATALDSTFYLAWARIAQTNATSYFSSPDPGLAEAARLAAERARAIAPGSPEAHLAMGDYYANVKLDQQRAREEYAAGLRLAPNHIDLLVGSAEAERATGNWEKAVEVLHRALSLDPRSGRASGALATHLLWLRRYPEATAAAEQAVTLAPENLRNFGAKVMIRLAQGDLPGARTIIGAAPKELTPTAVATNFAVTWDLFWVLDESQQSIVLRLGTTSFEDDAGARALAFTGIYHLRGDKARTKIYADSAHQFMQDRLRVIPDDNYLLALDAVALAYGGHGAEALREGERSVSLLSVAQDAYSGPYNLHELVRVYAILGEKDKAIARLKELLAIPYFVSPAWLRIDPTFDGLRGDPRFEALTK